MRSRWRWWSWCWPPSWCRCSPAAAVPSRLIEAGVPVALIRGILPILDDPGTILVTGPSPELVSALEEHRSALDARIQCITRNRDAITGYLDALRSGAQAHGGS